PTWARVKYGPIDYQDLYYYSAPKKKAGPKSLDEIDPEILKTYEKLGIPLREQKILAGVVEEPAAGEDSDGETRSASTPIWSRSTSGPWCRPPTTSLRRSTRRCSPTARSSTCRRACAARWS